MRFTTKRKLAIAATAAAAAAFAGGAYAATQTSGTSRQAFLNDVAKRLNVSPTQLQSALQGAFDDQLQAAVTAGKLTQAQANALKQHIQQRGGAPLGFGGLLHPGAPRLRRAPGMPGAPGLLGAPGHPFLGVHGGRFSAAAKYLGVSESQLLKQLASGKTLAQIAKAQGKSASGLKAAMTAAVKTRLDKAVGAKLLTSAQEQKILSNLGSIIDAQINGRAIAKLGFRRGFGPGGIRVYPGWARPGIGPGSVPVPPPPPGQIF
jgi:hypothetical protein